MKVGLECKRWASCLLVVMGFAMASVASADANNPETIIAAESAKLMGMLTKEGATFSSNPQPLYTQVTNQLRGIADLPAIAKGVMGRYYKTATADQQKRFAGVFEKSMVKIYSDSLMKAKPKSITMIPATKASTKPRKSKVTVKIAAENGSVYQVSYSMLLNKQDKWVVRNIVVDGVNFGLTYRNQFQSEMQQSGNNIDQVIANWTKSSSK